MLVKSGDIKLPKFQRSFVWRRSDMLQLLDSIYKGYPVGSLLLWNSSQRLKSEREIAGLKVDEESTVYPTSYLLDGQQRLTTICGALYWEGSGLNSIWNIHFDLETEEFVHPKGAESISTYPLNQLLETHKFIKQCMKFAHHEKHLLYTERAERLLRIIKDYKIAVVKIGDMSIEQVAPIFERINSTGRKLTIVDLMMAATWSNGFDLSYEIKSIQSKCIETGFSGLSGQMILRSIAASAGFGVNKDDIQKLRALTPEALKSASDSCSAAILKSVAWLRSELLIRDANYLPYGLFFTFLVEIFRLDPCPSDDKLAEIKSWFWFTSATLYFGGASTGDISRELVSVRDFSQGASSFLYKKSQINIGNLIYDKFNLKNASSIAFSLLLISRRPEHTVTGKNLDLEILSEKNARLFGKIAPKGIEDLNISIVVEPSKNFNVVTEAGPNLAEHYLDAECLKNISEANSEGFIWHRAGLIADAVMNLTGCEPLLNLSDVASDEEEINSDAE
ncbi:MULTISPECIES: DUF262 domain-containing protein [Pseudomonas]|nr:MULTISPECIES: DUF262 domain-containing protein [Pseudomonas]ELF6204254.1 DUF262 domain-containing protein [Pseudomonas putida]MBF8803177.1 DUF262 domain-containing protein [Pseudomonas asiatica]MCE0881791.1 DUF262 domain-containing protein [Pseudomonas putida]MCE0967046.1 DUF262 domain-containing protein [Pseudomonas sp. NMI4491_12]MDO1494503.1 DUF262 domain-containing protein [Pseudomonas putida]